MSDQDDELRRLVARQSVELERDRAMVAHMRNVVDLVDRVERLPVTLALVALKALEAAAGQQEGPLAAALARAATSALGRLK